MRPPRTFVVAAGCVAGAIALAGVVMLAASSRDASANPTPPDPIETAVQQPEPEAENEQPQTAPEPPQPRVDESTHAFFNASIEDLLTGFYAALDREDYAWVARAFESTHGRELHEGDIQSAFRNVIHHDSARMWNRARQAWDTRDFETVEDGEVTTLKFNVGGNLGTMSFSLKRLDNGWYLAGL